MGGTNFWGNAKEDNIFLPPSFDDGILEVREKKKRKKIAFSCKKSTQVPPRLELGSLDSESKVLTITPWDRSYKLKFIKIWFHHCHQNLSFGVIPKLR